jgi:integrase
VVEVNVCSGVRVPAIERRPARVLSREEMRRLQVAADADDNAAIGPFVALELATGARKGELRALAWGPEGLDLAAGMARVRWTMDVEQGRVATKNREARDVPLGPAVVARMRRWRLASPGSQDGGLVFPGREPREAWKRIRKAAALADPQPVFHDLRHAVCSALRASGLESHEVAEIVGHKDGGRLVDRLYAHALPERVAGAGALMEAWMAAPPG